MQQAWEDQFSFCYDEYDSFVFPVSIHPQVSGKAKVLPMHRRFVDFLKAHDGVEFVPAEFVCDEQVVSAAERSPYLRGASVPGFF